MWWQFPLELLFTLDYFLLLPPFESTRKMKPPDFIFLCIFFFLLVLNQDVSPEKLCQLAGIHSITPKPGEQEDNTGKIICLKPI